jgi:hypothetical protein
MSSSLRRSPGLRSARFIPAPQAVTLFLALVLPAPLLPADEATSAGGASAPASTAAAHAPVPRLALLPIDAALARVREHLASRPEEAGREVVGLQFIPPHGRPGPGFWLVDLAPYPTDRPIPARTVSSLLLSMDGSIEERGGRRSLNPTEVGDRDQAAATLHQRMREASEASAAPAAPAE